MSVILLLIPLSLCIAAGFLAAFVWAVSSGQYEDTKTPSMRMLLDEPTRLGKSTVPLPRAKKSGSIKDSHATREGANTIPFN